MQHDAPTPASTATRAQTVFVHGAGESSGIWLNQIDYFPRSLFIDLPGHGKTTGDPCRTVQEYASWLHDFLATKKTGKVNLVGHSMGGAIVIEFAIAHAEMADSIALVATGAKLRVSPIILEGLRDRPEEVLRTILDWSFSKSTDHARDKFMEILRRTSIGVAETDYKACNNFDRMTSVSQIRVPCLAVCGSEDRMTPPKFSQYLAEKIHGSMLAIIPDAGHMVMMEQPAKFNGTLASFLSRVDHNH